MSVMPTLTPDELLAAAELAPSINELERIGQECFAPWIDAAKNGDLSIGYVRRLPGLNGYSAVFEQLRAPGLQVGVNSHDGQNHVIQNAFWQPVNALWAKSKGGKVATTKHATASGEIDVQRYIGVTSHLLQSSDAVELAVGLAAATGRRSIEIVFIGKFSPVKATPDFLSEVSSEYLYQFQNPAKKRNYEQAASSRPKFTSTALFRASDILKAWKALQSCHDVKAWVAQQTKQLRAAKWSKEAQIKANSAFNTDWASRLNATT